MVSFNVSNIVEVNEGDENLQFSLFSKIYTFRLLFAKSGGRRPCYGGLFSQSRRIFAATVPILESASLFIELPTYWHFVHIVGIVVISISSVSGIEPVHLNREPCCASVS